MTDTNRLDAVTEGRREQYVDSLFSLVNEGKVEAFDVTTKPIPLEFINQKFDMYDTVKNDGWTRPKFINNVYHGSQDGIVLKRQFRFDTITFNETSIAFIEWQRDEWRNIINHHKRPIEFIIKRNPSLIKTDDVKNSENEKLKNDPVSFKVFKKIANSTWKNISVSTSFGNDTAKFKLDSCQRLFRLHLNSDMTFQQSYNGKPICSTVDMYPDIEVGVFVEPIRYSTFQLILKC